MKTLLVSTVLLLSVFGALAQSKPEEDLAGVRQACFDYIDAFYKADTTLAFQSVHPTLQKRGFSFDEKTGAYSRQLEMP
ncbi:MAG: hypothetical protein JWP57_1657, partial [Spirosoma sp.]|nr:hypothetical protein [Spirosoma sp.]